MKLIVAGETRELPDSITVAELLEIEKVETPQYVSVQVNEEFVRTERYNDRQLNDGDRIEFMYFMGGGRYHEFNA